MTETPSSGPEVNEVPQKSQDPSHIRKLAGKISSQHTKTLSEHILESHSEEILRGDIQNFVGGFENALGPFIDKNPGLFGIPAGSKLTSAAKETIVQSLAAYSNIFASDLRDKTRWLEQKKEKLRQTIQKRMKTLF